MRSECQEVRLVCLCPNKLLFNLVAYITPPSAGVYLLHARGFFINSPPLPLTDRDIAVRQYTKLLPYYWLRLTRGKNMNKWMSSGRLSTKARSVYLDYLHQSGKVINDCDLTIKRFNYVRLPQFCSVTL